MAEFMEAASSLTFGVWFLVGTAMVFFMQCGFAMVEAGFTRAKNAGNIIMKKPDGLLYRVRRICNPRQRLNACRRLYCRGHRHAEPRHFHKLG